jgi:hypothetical protein
VFAYDYAKEAPHYRGQVSAGASVDYVFGLTTFYESHLVL